MNTDIGKYVTDILYCKSTHYQWEGAVPGNTVIPLSIHFLSGIHF